MCKAYDRLEWLFLEKMLCKLGFAEAWVEKVMRSVRSVSYVVQINQCTTRVIWPTRGLRQGDPLSPYLFILASEWLSKALEDRAEGQRRAGLKICTRSPPVSHLLFADDSLIFMEAESEEMERIKSILDEYEQISGQKINYEKSQMVCSPNTSLEQRGEAGRVLGVEMVEKHDKYLGLPTVVGQKKKEAFREIEDKLAKRVMGWKAKLLSMAGRGVLIKAVLAAMPQYAMTCYKLPVSVCNRFQKLINRFFWGATEGKTTIQGGKKKRGNGDAEFQMAQ